MASADCSRPSASGPHLSNGRIQEEDCGEALSTGLAHGRGSLLSPASHSRSRSIPALHLTRSCLNILPRVKANGLSHCPTPPGLERTPREPAEGRDAEQQATRERRGSHPSPREEAVFFSEPRGDEGESASGLLFPWELEGVSGCSLSALSWERAGGDFSPLSRERILFPSPAPPPSTPTATSSLGNPS